MTIEEAKRALETLKVKIDRERAIVRDMLKFGEVNSSPIFRDHSCWRCKDGTKPCPDGGAHRCEYPHARND